MALKAVAFDFDGTLVDSYQMFPHVYSEIADKLNIEDILRPYFVKVMVALEDVNDYLSKYNRLEWWPNAFKAFNISISSEVLRELHDYFLKRRIEETRILPEVHFVLQKIPKKFIIAGTDGIPNLKRKRIEQSGLAKFFDKIIIINENASSLKEAVKIISDEFTIENKELALVDDKPSRLIAAKKLEITPFLVNFKGPLKLAWEKNRNIITSQNIRVINSLSELLNYL